MAAKLEEWCQLEVEALLHQKEHLLSRKPAVTSEECKLPHYKTVVALQKSVEERELFFLEVNDKLKVLEREKEIRKMKTAFASLRLHAGTFENSEPEGFVRKWFKQMLSYEKKTRAINKKTDEKMEISFFDIDFNEIPDNDILTWSTLYKGRCIRVSVVAPTMCSSADPSIYHFSSSFYVTGLVDKGKEFISSGKTPEEYTKVLWAGLQTLINIK